MRSVIDIDRELDVKRRELEELRGTETEIYSRIVGYYRSVRNWNKGKREEYRHRVTFAAADRAVQPELALTPFSQAENPRSEARARDDSLSADIPQAIQNDGPPADQSSDWIASVTYFFRHACPNCKPVRSLISEFPVSVRDVDVDTEEGMELAIEHQILATPTALFSDAAGRIVFRSSDPREIADLLKSAG